MKRFRSFLAEEGILSISSGRPNYAALCKHSGRVQIKLLCIIQHHTLATEPEEGSHHSQGCNTQRQRVNFVVETRQVELSQ